MAEATKELAPIPPLRVTKKDLELARAAILGDAELPAAADPEIVSRAIMERILDAETFEEAFRPQDLEGWQEYAGVPVLVRGFHLNRSKYGADGEESEEGSGVYAVVDIAPMTDGGTFEEVVTVTTGSKNVLAQLVKMLEKQLDGEAWMERPVKLTQTKTSEGFTVLRLESV